MSDLDKFLSEELDRDPAFKKVWNDPKEREATSIGMSLGLARELRGLTVKQLARSVGAKPRQITDMELDVRAIPKAILVKVLKLLLNKSVVAKLNETNMTLARRVTPNISDRLRKQSPVEH